MTAALEGAATGARTSWMTGVSNGTMMASDGGATVDGRATMQADAGATMEATTSFGCSHEGEVSGWVVESLTGTGTGAVLPGTRASWP
jgi:hypothetical protein